MRAPLISITFALLLSGCASCGIVEKLQPSVAKTSDVAVTIDANLDSLFLESYLISLWLKPCVDRSGTEIYGSLCGTFIVPPKRRFILESAILHVRDTSTGQDRSLQLVPLDFKLAEVEVGSGEPTTRSWPANRPYQLPGSWLGVRLLGKGEIDSSSELRMPAANLDGRSFTFPLVALNPARGQTCVHYH
jgi:hypothetical protein